MTTLPDAGPSKKRKERHKNLAPDKMLTRMQRMGFVLLVTLLLVGGLTIWWSRRHMIQRQRPTGTNLPGTTVQSEPSRVLALAPVILRPEADTPNKPDILALVQENLLQKPGVSLVAPEKMETWFPPDNNTKITPTIIASIFEQQQPNFLVSLELGKNGDQWSLKIGIIAAQSQTFHQIEDTSPKRLMRFASDAIYAMTQSEDTP